MELLVHEDAEAVGLAAASLVRQRVQAKPGLVFGVPAGRSPRPMYRALARLQHDSAVDFSRLRLVAIDELCPPAPLDGIVWRQVRSAFLSWAPVPAEACQTFDVGAGDLHVMCDKYEQGIRDAGGLDLVMLGLGPNGHIGANEPGSAPDSRTRVVTLLPETLAYFLADPVNGGLGSDRAVTLGLGTILQAREVVLIATGRVKREPLRRLLSEGVTPGLPVSNLRRHARCTILADREATSCAGTVLHSVST